MPKFLTCPQGHRWEIDDKGNALTADLEVRCPACGAIVDLVTPNSAEEPVTLPPRGTPEVQPLAPTIEPVAAVLNKPDLPGYEILAELGRGGMGVVYTARQTKLDRLVAVKVMPPQTSDDSAFSKRFDREARALAKLNHPHIVTIYDFGQTEGHAYFIMEYVSGVNLRQRLETGPMTPREVLQIAMQICDALQYAHDEGIVHRDIKPENILLDKKGRVKIADFGLAKFLVREAANYTLTGPMQVMGTFKYMAPEQLEKPQEVDHRADIYSLGVVFYKMLTGELPLGRFAPPSRKVPGVDVRLDEVVLRALETEPGRRYQKVAELQAAFASIANPRSARLDELGSSIVEPDTLPFADKQSQAAQKPIGLLILAALALLAFWPVGLALFLGFAIWRWFVLRRPDGKTVLRRHILKAESIVRAASRRYLFPVFCTTTGWAIIFCALGVIATFQPVLPLAELQIPTQSNRGVPIVQVFGYESMLTTGVGAIFASLFLLLVATSYIEPIPVWRSVFIIIAGTGCILMMGLALLSNRPTVNESFGVTPEYYIVDVLGKNIKVNLPVGNRLPPDLTRLRLSFPAYMIVALSSGLVLVGTFQLRGVLMRRVTKNREGRTHLKATGRTEP